MTTDMMSTVTSYLGALQKTSKHDVSYCRYICIPQEDSVHVTSKKNSEFGGNSHRLSLVKGYVQSEYGCTVHRRLDNGRKKCSG